MDVAVRCNGRDARLLAMIECKDWKRPVGIATIDALDSKRRDFECNVAIVCSNSGFTVDALKKASRLGLGAMSALAKEDYRITVVVQKELVAPQIDVHDLGYTFHFQKPLPQDAQISLGDRSLASALYTDAVSEIASRVLLRDASLPTHASWARRVTMNYEFKAPQAMLANGMLRRAVGCALSIPVVVRWYSKVVAIDASAGLYDHDRKAVVYGTGPNRFEYKNVVLPLSKGEPINDVPAPVIAPSIIIRMDDSKEDEYCCAIAQVVGTVAAKGPPVNVSRVVKSRKLAHAEITTSLLPTAV